MQTLTELLLARSSEEHLTITLVASPPLALSFADWIARAARLASWLQPRTRLGEVVFLIGDTQADLLVALLSCWWSGCVPCCWPPPARLLQGDSYASALQRAVAAATRNGGLGLADARLLPRLQQVSLAGGWWALDPLEAGREAVAPPRPGSEIGLLQFSSGTTQDPKPIWLSQTNLLAQLEAIACLLPGGRTGHACCSWLPLHHDMGLVGSLLSALYAPGNLTLLTPMQFALRPGMWLDWVERSQSTITVGPNFALEQLLLRDSGRERQLQHLQRFLIGSEWVRPSTLRRFHQVYGPQGLAWEALTPVYGLAENTLAVTFSQGPKIHTFELAGGPREIVSLGHPIAGVELQVVDEFGQPLPEGQVGRLCVAGPCLAAHLPSPYDTGDLGLLWQGELYYVGRSKDVLVYQGVKHSPEVLEGLLEEECVALMSPQEVPTLVVEHPRRGVLAAEDIRVRLSRAPFTPDIQLVEAGWLPRTSSGKLSRSRARRKLWP